MRVLLAEDSDEDLTLITYALKQCPHPVRLNTVCDASQAIKYLLATRPYDDREAHPFPSLLITDLKMPQGSGLDLLRWLKDRPECATVPTIVLTSSALASDVESAYDLKANAFLTKPNDLTDLIHMMRVTIEFWSLCERPPIPATFCCQLEEPGLARNRP